MNPLIIKLLWLVIGFALSPLNQSHQDVIVVLIVVTLSTYIYWQSSTVAKLIYVTIYLVVLMVVPTAIVYLPLVIYDLNLKQFYVHIGWVVFFLVYQPPMTIGLMCIVSIVVTALNMQLHHWHEQYYRLLDQSNSQLNELKKSAIMQQDMQNKLIMLATNEERSRIARDIHDQVGHILSRSLIQLGAIEVVNQDERLNQPLGQLHDSLQHGMEAIRTSVHGLYAMGFDLVMRIQSLKDTQMIEVDLKQDTFRVLPELYGFDVYSILSEAIANSIKHGHATKIRIRLKVFPDFYQLVLHDNGTSSTLKVSEGIGLKSIQDRVSKWRGSCRFISEDGFKIHIVLPREKGDLT